MADLSTRYAKALFELSVERGLTEDYLEQAAFISGALEESEHILTHPRIPRAEKYAFLDAAFKGRVHDDLLGFMHLTVTKDREEFMASALGALVEMIRRHQNYTTAKVVSAVALTPEQLDQLKLGLMNKLGKQVELEAEVDTSLIGGVRIHVDGYVLDRTVKYLLREMKHKISS